MDIQDQYGGPSYSIVVKPNLSPDEVTVGTLLTNPRRPDNGFFSADSWMLGATERPPVPFACQISKSDGNKFGLFASFAGMIGGSADYSRSKHVGKWLCAGTVVEKSFKPDAAFLQGLSLKADVQNHLRDAIGQKKAWLITGIKIGWNVSISDSRVESAGVSGSLTGGAQGFGGGLSGQHTSGTQNTFYYWQPGPVVFGVELMKLKVKGDGSLDPSMVPGQFFGKDQKSVATDELVPDEEPADQTIVNGYDEMTGKDCRVLLVSS